MSIAVESDEWERLGREERKDERINGLDHSEINDNAHSRSGINSGL